MPVTRLFPITVDLSGSDLTPNSSPEENILKDASDATWWSRVVSTTEPARFVRGSAVTQLPVTSGKLVGVTIGVRAWCNQPLAARVTVSDFSLGTNLFEPTVTTTITTYTSSPIAIGNFVAVNAMNWGATARWNPGEPATDVRIYELFYDVEWYPTGGMQAMMLGLLGPLVALGLHEMPGLSAFLWRRYRTRLLPGELRQAWLEVRAHRHPRSVLLGRYDATRTRHAGRLLVA